jgi:hypothetical protein
LSTISIFTFLEEDILGPWDKPGIVRLLHRLRKALLYCLWSFILLFSTAFCAEEPPKSTSPSGSSISCKEKISLSLALHDTRQTYLLLEELKQIHSDLTSDPEALALLFDYLAEIQDIEGMRILYEKVQTSEGLSIPQATLEHIAWVNITSASRAYHPKIRAEALLAAAESQDVRGMRIIKSMITDSHQGIQQIALQLAASYPDEPIQQKAEEIARFDIPEAKLAAARLLAMQKAPRAKTVLASLLVDETLSEEDQVEVASLLAHLKEEVDFEWLQKAVIDRRPAIRALAASSVLEAPTKERLLALLPLLGDPSANVKKCAFQTLGIWQSLIPETALQIIQVWTSHLQSPSFDLSAVAAWALLLSTNDDAKIKACAWFENALLHMTKEKALIAASHLIKTGNAGLPLTSTLIAKVQDPLTRINLAQYLLYHRKNVEEASEILRTSIAATTTLLGECSDGVFSWFGASSLPHHPEIPRLPESQDLFLRLQLLAVRCYSEQPIPREEVETMLNDRGWGISGAAAAFLFQEFGHSLDEILTPLLSHPTETVRIQAALLLTFVSRSQQAAKVLAEQYEKASREGKEAIILGFSCLPSARTKQYLIPLLFDPSPSLRTRAAGALLCSMYY